METGKAPKQWCLTKIETINSFESWRHNLSYVLALDRNFAGFLVPGVTWLKKTRNNPNRGLFDDPAQVPEATRRTAAQKTIHLELMLGQIANYCPVISRNTIVKNSTSIETIWQAIRTHYGFQSTGGHFLDLANMKLEVDERPEDLYQRLMAFIEDSLLQSNGSITHHGEILEEEEELTPTLENIIVLLWLKLTHSDLPRLVRQRYGTELRARTLASIKPEISQALPSLLDEIRGTEEVRVMRSTTSFRPSFQNTRGRGSKPQQDYDRRRGRNKLCPLCKQAGRVDINHFLSACSYLPESDRRFITKARLIASLSDDVNFQDNEDNTEYPTDIPDEDSLPSQTRRVQTKQSPYLHAFYKQHSVKITIDSGAEVNLINQAVAHQISAPILPTTQIACQADGVSPMEVVGETHLSFSHSNKPLSLQALVVKDLDVDIIGGIPFMTSNDITIRPSRHQIILKDNTICSYKHLQQGTNKTRPTASGVLRCTQKETVWPGEYIEVNVPEGFDSESPIAIEPQINANNTTRSWPQHSIVTCVAGKVRIPNTLDLPLSLKRHEHIGRVSHTFEPDTKVRETTRTGTEKIRPSKQHGSKFFHSNSVKLDPDGILNNNVKQNFQKLHEKFDNIFNPDFPGYNGTAGPIKGVVNMGSVQPPQRKGRVPQYSRDKLSELQEHFDTLEKKGVFKRPEDLNIVAEYLNPSFLVKKTSGGYRLVTAFADVGRYTKPQPSLMPCVDSVLRQIACWRYIITTDLTSAFYQIPLSETSMKYCGVVTPFKGVRVYARCAMGMPGSETALEELMSRVLGDLVQDGIVVKLADDLYCGGNTPLELFTNWERILNALHEADLRLSASKTVIAPKTTTILGWIWCEGSIRASPHRISALTTCEPPNTVKGLRSFIGAYKILARVLPHCASHLAPLDNMAAGLQSNDKLNWSDDLYSAFDNAKKSLQYTQIIYLPQTEDQLWIVTDGAIRKPGLGATLYTTKNNEKPKVAEFFSTKLNKLKIDWLPCEVEALCIAASIHHFSPYIIQSNKRACVLTDSKPCVQAFEKLCRGEFSVSPRLATFLTAVSRYQVNIRHLSGSVNLPSDFQCRNAPECLNPDCRVCSFAQSLENSAVRNISVQDIIAGTTKLPFITRSTWIRAQAECPDLRRTHAHLLQGTRPSKKIKNIRDIRRYLQCTTIARDGLLVVKRSAPFESARECIVIPRGVLPGLLHAIHLKLDHPSQHQLSQVMARYFFALDINKMIEEVSSSCHLCASLRKSPHVIIDQSTSEPPAAIGTSFCADVLRRNRQFLLVLRETVTSFTTATIITDEQHSTLRDNLIRLCIEMRPLEGPPAVIRTDSAPGFQSIKDDKLLKQCRMTIEIGRTKNPNKNPVAERAIQELELELLHQDQSGNPITPLTLSLAVSRLNSRLRRSGLSAREMWLQRDQFTNTRIPVDDEKLILDQHSARQANHEYSEIAKAPTGRLPVKPFLQKGNIVYLYADGNKHQCRDRYIVVSTDDPEWCEIRKFGNSQIRKATYRVKQTECYKVPQYFIPTTLDSTRRHYNGTVYDDEDKSTGNESINVTPSATPETPTEITDPIMCSSSQSQQETTLTQTDDVGSDNNGTTDCASPQELRRSSRNRTLPKHFDDFIL